MKKATTQILFILACIFLAISCNDDGDLKLTKTDGKPSGIKNDEANVFFYYQGDRLSRIKEIKGSISDFRYENNDLVSVSYSPEDKRVADGHGSTTFRKEGNNKIIIESSGEPDFRISRWEIEIDGNNIPLKMTEIGYYSHTPPNGELAQVEEGKYYAIFDYDPITRNLRKLTVYNKVTSQLLSTSDYEYDDNPGIVSKIDLPLWYYAYKAYRNKDFWSPYNRIYFNHHNNIIKETFSAEDIVGQNIFNYTYKYNKGNVPVSMAIDVEHIKEISITY